MIISHLSRHKPLHIYHIVDICVNPFIMLLTNSKPAVDICLPSVINPLTLHTVKLYEMAIF